MAKKQVTTTAPPEFRVRVVVDDNAQFEECNGEARPLTKEEYANNAYEKDGEPVSYEDYLDYYGNPDRHIYAGVIVDRLCPCCGHWEKHVASVWAVDFMDDNPEAAHIGSTYTVAEALALPGYLAEIAREELSEAGYELGPKHKCQHKDCPYWTVLDAQQDRRFCAQHQPKIEES